MFWLLHTRRLQQVKLDDTIVQPHEPRLAQLSMLTRPLIPMSWQLEQNPEGCHLVRRYEAIA